MSRIGYDCIGGNAAWVRANLPLPAIMFWYGTGSPNVMWTVAEEELFPASILVEIDQGGNGTPVMSAIVRDVENGAWAPGQAVNRTGWNVERPTIYCTRNTLPSVLADGWDGDIWLAWPGWNGEPLPNAGAAKIVAVQDAFDNNYDHTTVLDATWPRLVPIPPPKVPMSVTVVSRTAHIALGVMAGADHYVINYVPASGSKVVTVARIPQPDNGAIVHGGALTVPDARGGNLEAYAIVSAKPILIGTRPLP